MTGCEQSGGRRCPTLDLLDRAVRFAHDPGDWLLRRELQAALVDIYLALELAADGDEAAAMVLGGEFPMERAAEALGERE